MYWRLVHKVLNVFLYQKVLIFNKNPTFYSLWKTPCWNGRKIQMLWLANIVIPYPCPLLQYVMCFETQDGKSCDRAISICAQIRSRVRKLTQCSNCNSLFQGSNNFCLLDCFSVYILELCFHWRLISYICKNLDSQFHDPFKTAILNCNNILQNSCCCCILDQETRKTTYKNTDPNLLNGRVCLQK